MPEAPASAILADLLSQITSICAEVMNRPTLEADDDLIAMGMDSVAAVEIVTRIETAYGVDVVDAIFDTPTVARLCEVVRASHSDGHS